LNGITNQKEDLGLDWGITLQPILKKYNWKALAGLIWLRKGKNCGLLVPQNAGNFLTI
jgi:hypothetical protein